MGLALVALAAVLGSTVGCGARLTDQQRQAALATGRPSATTAAATASAPAPAEAAPLPVPGTATNGRPASATPPTAAPASAACTPRGAGPGVTPTEVRLGNVSTITGPVPGLGQTAQDGTRAYVNWVNSRGGVCGRRLRLLASDDRLDSGANRSETQHLAAQVLGFVGSWSVGDDGGASILRGTDIPDVTLAVSDQRITLPNNFSPNPIDPTSPGNGNEPMMRWFREQRGVTKGAIVYPAQAAARKRALAFQHDMEAAGITVVVKAETALTQTDYTGVATQIKNAGADLVTTALEVGGMAKLAQSFRQQRYTPKVAFYGAQSYSRKFLQLAGDAAEGATLGMAEAIAEDAPANPSMAAFTEWYGRTAPGADVDFFAILAWAATDLMVKAIEGAGPTPTRGAVLANLKRMTDVDAGGIIPPGTNPAGKKPSGCFMIATVEGGRWVRTFPTRGFQC